MKIVRVVLIVVGAVVVLLAGAIALAFSSGFQTWAARKALAGQSGVVTSLDRVDAGWQKTVVSGITVRTAGAMVTVPRVELDVPLLPAASRRVEIKKLVAHGWTVDLTPGGTAVDATTAAQATSAQAAAVFRGVLSELQLPVALTIGTVDLEGVVLLPAAAGQAPLRMQVKLTGGDLGPGRPGTFTLEAAATLAADAPVHSLKAHSVITAAMDTASTFSHLAVTTELDANGPQLAAPAHLVVLTTADRDGGGETYATNIASGGRTLLKVHADFPAQATKLTGTWEIAMGDADVAPYTLGLPLPQFRVEGGGEFSTEASFATVAASGKLDVATDKLANVRPDLGVLGALKITADFDVRHEGGATVRVNRLTAAVAGAKPVLHVQALQPFAFNPQTAELKIADPAKELLELTIDGVPLAWARPFLSEMNISGSDVQGQFFLSPRTGGLSLRARTPLAVKGVTVAVAGQALVRDLDVALSPSFDFTAQGWQAGSGDLSVRSGGALLFALNARAGRLAGGHDPLKATGEWSANLPALLTQPLFAGKLALKQGEATGNFAASVDGRQEVQAKIALTKLAADPAPSAPPLPNVTLELRASVDPDHTVTFTVPIAVERQGRKSDLNVAGTLSHSAHQPVIDARVTSDYVWLDDLQPLAAPLASGGDRAPGEPAGRDASPIWAGVSGKISLALKKVVYGTDYELTNITGTVTLDAGAARLDAFQARLGADSDVRANGAVTFDTQAARPYALTADVQVANFDPGPLFKALKPGQPATVEGIFNATSTLRADGGNIGNLIDRARGDVTLTSKGGKFRALSADLSDKIQKSSSTVAAIGGLIGAVTGKSQPAEYANKSQVAADIAKALSDIAYDQMTVDLTRDDALNFKVKDFSLISPEVRLTGTGEIRHAENVPILKSAMALSFQLGARGKLGEKMKHVSLLAATTDALGYTTCNIPLKIGGTLENPDASSWQNALLKAALEKSGLFNELLGK